MTRYMRWLAAERGVEADSYEALWEWSVTELEDFWASIWEYFHVESSGEYSTVLAKREMPGAKWFEGAELNYAEHIFRGKDPDAVAVCHASELRELGEIRWGELREQVAAVAEALRALGVERGDRVVAYLPNGPEALIAFLASASLGAIWSSCSPDFGPGSVVDRFAQIEPKVMFAVDGYRYGGKDFDRLDTVADVAAQIPSLERIVVVPYLSASPDLSRLESREGVAAPMTWGQLTDLGAGVELRFERVPFDHPLWVLYSSGTTGLPKAIVQGHGGILLEQLKKSNLHLDAQGGDRVFWFTTTGWMMWNFLIGVLLTPASIVLYDGSPGHPGHGRPLGPGRAHRHDLLRDQRQLHRRLHEGRGRAEQGPRPLAPALRRLDRLPALPRGLRVGLRARRARHLALLHQRRHRRLHRLRRRRPDPARLPRRAPGPRPGRQGRVLRRGRQAPDRRGRRAGPDRADALDARLLLGRRGRLALPRQLLRAVPRRLAPRRLDRDHLARHGDHLRPLGLDDQPRRACAWAPARSTARCRPSRRSSTPLSWTSPARAARAGCRCSWSWPRAPSSTTRWSPGSRRASASSAPRATCRTRSTRSTRSRARSRGKVLEVPVKRILMGEPVERAASRDSLANPASLDYFVELSRSL